nr:hypothetical protein OHB51_35525 [Micromonospora sp. NBC_00855]
MTTTEPETNGTTAETDAAKPELPNFTTTVDWHGAPDTELQSVANYANASIGIGITLLLPWGLASGLTIPVEKFFELTAEKMRNDTADTPNEAGMETYASNFVDPVAEGYSNLDDTLTFHQGHKLVRHIHLENVTAVVGGKHMTFPYLRILLSEVSGWLYGQTGFTD